MAGGARFGLFSGCHGSGRGTSRVIDPPETTPEVDADVDRAGFPTPFGGHLVPTDRDDLPVGLFRLSILWFSVNSNEDRLLVVPVGFAML